MPNNNHSHEHLSQGSADRNNSKKLLRIVFGSIFLLALIILAVYLIREHRIQKEYEALSPSFDQVFVTPVPTSPPDPMALPEATPEPTPVPVNIPVDFDKLLDINLDVIGWICVEGTDIDYPILYDTDEYYLTHSIYNEYTNSGSIFVQDFNKSDFSDFNTAVYGHNMGIGTMFAQLHRFEKKDFFDEHDTVVVYRPNHKLTYRIFAAYRTDNQNQITVFDYSTAESRQAYIDRIFEHTYSNFDRDVPVSESDHILTLSTCIGDANYRYLVQAVLVSDEYGIYTE